MLILKYNINIRLFLIFHNDRLFFILGFVIIDYQNTVFITLVM